MQLTPGDQCIGDDDVGHAHEGQEQPSPRRTRQSSALPPHDQRQEGRPQDGPDAHQRERCHPFVEADLDEEVRAAPDEREQQEQAPGPRIRWRAAHGSRGSSTGSSRLKRGRWPMLALTSTPPARRILPFMDTSIVLVTI